MLLVLTFQEQATGVPQARGPLARVQCGLLPKKTRHTGGISLAPHPVSHSLVCPGFSRSCPMSLSTSGFKLPLCQPRCVLPNS